jgi:phage-related protein
MKAIRPLLRVGSAKKDLAAMPDSVQDIFGYALHLAICTALLPEKVAPWHRHGQTRYGFDYCPTQNRRRTCEG